MRVAIKCPPCDAGQHAPVEDGTCRCCGKKVED